LCHHSGREAIRAPGRGRASAQPDPVIPPLPEVVREYEQAAAWVRPASVLGIALNTLGLPDGAARDAAAAAARAAGLAASDPVRFGVGPIADALMTRLVTWRRHATAP